MDTPDFSLNKLFLHSDAPRPKLRIGVLADAAGVPRFARQVIDDIQSCDFAEIVCIAFNQAHSGHEHRGARRPLWRRLRRLGDAGIRSRLLYGAYSRWLSAPPAPPLDPVEIVDNGLPAGSVMEFAITPIVKGHVHYFPADAVAAIRDLNLDVILRFGFMILRGDILSCARFGIWSFHHGDSASYRGGPPMLWELIEDNPVSGVVLQRLSERLDAGQVLIKARFATAETTSAAVNGYGPFWSTTHFVIQKLRELHRLGWACVGTNGSTETPYTGRRAIYKAPTNLEVVRWLAPLALRVTARRLRTLVRRMSGRTTTLHWRLGLRRSSIPLYEERSTTAALRAFQWIDSPHGHFWADPFLLQRGNSQLLFFEDFDYQAEHGSIAMAELSADGKLGEARIILRRPYHLSYPQVFEHAGETWMVPESSESGAIELWRARRFPDDWVLEQRLVEIRAVDPTIVFRHDRWWLFATPMAVMGHFAQTYLWTADQLTGPWRLHENGAICNDVSRARPAGRVIRTDRALVRPSQDCSGRYGRAIWFNEIDRLDDEAYAEHPVVRISSSGIPGLAGLHTYSRNGDWETIDGLFRIRMGLVR